LHRLVPICVLALALSLLSGGGAIAQSGGDSDLERRSGSGRIETAVDVALTDWPDGADTVLLATAENYPDALAAAPLAASLGAPLLLTPTAALPPVVGDAIDRLDPDDVIVLGGAGAVSDAVVRAVRGLRSAPEVERIAGTGRYETAAAIAGRAGAPHRMAVLATGLGFADALAAGATAGTPARPPVLLATDEALPPATIEALRELRIERVVLIGGGAAMAGSVEQQVRELGMEATRLSGRDRFGTAAAVLHGLPLFGEVRDRRRVVVATGTDFPDALTAGPLAARLGTALTLAAPGQVPPAVRDELQLRQARSAVLVGGNAALGRGAEEGLRASFQAPQPIRSADGPTLVVDGDPVTVTDRAWRTWSISDAGNPPTFTFVGAASGEVVDVLITDFDVRRVDDGARASLSIGAHGASGLPQEQRLRTRPLALHDDEEMAQSVGSVNLRLAGCPCTFRMDAGFGFEGIFQSFDVRGGFTLRAVRSAFPTPPLVSLPHAGPVEATVHGQTPGFDAQLLRGQVVSFGHRDGDGFDGRFNEHPTGVSVRMRGTNLMGPPSEGAAA
jgi:putative cell wall-binding protein